MNIDLVSSLNFNDANALRDFMLVHRLVHDETAAKLTSVYGVPQSSFGISSRAMEDAWIELMNGSSQRGTTPFTVRDWLNNHNQIHFNTFLLLGGQPSGATDLSVVDFSSAEQFYDWMSVHQEVHDFEYASLGLQ